MNKCTGCGICEAKCPTKTVSEFEQGIGKRPAIYKPFPQAVQTNLSLIR
jgi:heterodisulfide reductase subunit A